ncbi:choline transporter-like protein 5-A isoform 2-T8 [Amazona ochrocephala]
MAAGGVRVPAAAAAALCPGRCVTCTDVQASYSYEPHQWHYFKQFCEPGVHSPRKSAAQVLRDEDCPSMIIPSRPRMYSRLNIEPRHQCLSEPGAEGAEALGKGEVQLCRHL